jgi:hypothetical protein
MIRRLSVLFLLLFAAAVTSKQDESNSNWRGPLRFVLSLFARDARLKAVMDVSTSIDDADGTSNLSNLRNNDAIVESLVSEKEIRRDGATNAVLGNLIPEASKLSKYQEVLGERYIVYNSVIAATATSRETDGTKRKRRHSRSEVDRDGMFCTEDCSSRSHLPSNPEDHSIGSHHRW